MRCRGSAPRRAPGRRAVPGAISTTGRWLSSASRSARASSGQISSACGARALSASSAQWITGWRGARRTAGRTGMSRESARVRPASPVSISVTAPGRRSASSSAAASGTAAQRRRSACSPVARGGAGVSGAPACASAGTRKGVGVSRKVTWPVIVAARERYNTSCHVHADHRVVRFAGLGASGVSERSPGRSRCRPERAATTVSPIHPRHRPLCRFLASALPLRPDREIGDVRDGGGAIRIRARAECGHPTARDPGGRSRARPATHGPVCAGDAAGRGRGLSAPLLACGQFTPREYLSQDDGRAVRAGRGGVPRRGGRWPRPRRRRGAS
jgi:hypothetical protein